MGGCPAPSQSGGWGAVVQVRYGGGTLLQVGKVGGTTHIWYSEVVGIVMNC